jgi:hypothetical protein
VITVYNTGSIDAKNYKVEDQFLDASNGALSLVPSSNWKLSADGKIAEYKELINIPAKGKVTLTISFIVTDKANGKVRNLAVVCEGTNEDCDPTPPPVCDDETEVGTPEGCVEIEIEPYVYLVKSLASGQATNVSI